MTGVTLSISADASLEKRTDLVNKTIKHSTFEMSYIYLCFC